MSALRKERKKSFTHRIWLTILVSSLLMVFLVAFILIVFYREVLIDSIELQCSTEDNIHHESIQNYAETANSCVNTIILHLNAALEETDLVMGYPKTQTMTQKKIYRCMLNTFSMFRDPVEVLVLWNNGAYFYQEKGYTMRYGGMELLEELQRLNINRKGKWVTGINSDAVISGDGLYFIKPYTDLASGKLVGYVMLSLKSLESFRGVSATSRTYYLFSEDGLLLQTTDEAAYQRIWSLDSYEQRCRESDLLRGELLESEGSRNTLFHAQMLNCGWEFIALADMGRVLNPLLDTAKAIIAACAAVMLMMSGALCLVINRTIRPIRLLSSHMQAGPGTLPEIFSMKHDDDEIGVLIDRYNQMALNNHELFNQVVENEHIQKHLEFSLLQAQIKPHFLYNSLDVIYCLNAVGRYGEASTMTKLLSEYYRRSLSAGMECIPLADEIEMTRIYLEIQMVRYRNVLNFAIEYEKPLPELSIPKLTLQPLVENAIYHGIKPLGRPGSVKIVVSSWRDWLEVRVMDNGIGFSKAQFEHALSENVTPDESFGLRNVAERLRLYYGENGRLELEPVECGTSIVVGIRKDGRKAHSDV